MFKKVVFSGAILFCIAHAAVAQVMLEHKLPEGSSYLTETVANFSQTLSLAGTNVETASGTTSVTRSTIGKRDPAGTVRVTQKAESLKADVEVMGQTYSFDSANPDEKGSSPLELYRAVHKAVLERTFTFIYDKSNHVVGVEFDQDPLASVPAEARDVARSQL